MESSPIISSPEGKQKRTKRLTSILPECLDVITEQSENSESSLSQSFSSINECVVQTNALKSSPARSPSHTRKVVKHLSAISEESDDNPKRKAKVTKKPPVESSDDSEGVSQRRKMRVVKPAADISENEAVSPRRKMRVAKPTANVIEENGDISPRRKMRAAKPIPEISEDSEGVSPRRKMKVANQTTDSDEDIGGVSPRRKMRVAKEAADLSENSEDVSPKSKLRVAKASAAVVEENESVAPKRSSSLTMKASNLPGTTCEASASNLNPNRSSSNQMKVAIDQATVREENEGNSSEKRGVRDISLHPLNADQSNVIGEGSENDSTGETDKLTESDGGCEESEDDESNDSENEDSPGRSLIKASSLTNFFQTPGESQQVSELPVFDGDAGSVMMFDYDDEENDDGADFSSKRSVASSYCACDDDDELTWRLEPSQSLSDWTIAVINKSTRSTDLYHVHKNILAIGKRKSEYFAGIFRQQRQARDQPNYTELILPDTAARMIPMLLDFSYSNEIALNLSSETAPGLRYLAQFFGIKILFEKIMKFIQKDLSLKTLSTYYKCSMDLGDKKILSIAARHCARNIHLIDESHHLISVMDPPFFCEVLSSPGIEGVEKRMHLSILVAKYCQQHMGKIDGAVFLKLTNEELLPQVHYSASLTLLGMEADLVVAMSVASMMSISSLQERCITGLASHWRELSELDPAKTAQICRKLPSYVLTELLLRSLESAKIDDGTTRVVVKKGVKVKDEALMKKEYDESLDKLKAEYTDKMSHLQELCYEKDKHIKSYYEELNRFHRLPNSLDGKLAASGRTSQPSIMPAIGKHVAEGYLLVGKKKGSSKYPVFFYKGEEKE